MAFRPNSAFSQVFVAETRMAKRIVNLTRSLRVYNTLRWLKKRKNTWQRRTKTRRKRAQNEENHAKRCKKHMEIW